MNIIKKKVDSVTLTKIHPTKEWSVELSETASYGIQVVSSSYAPFSDIYYAPTQANNVYYMINRMFYKQGKSPYYYSSNDIKNLDIKFLNAESTAIFIPADLFGDRIQAGSVQISSSANTIKISDNYDGQLIDTHATQIVSDTNLVAWWSFDDLYYTNGVLGNYNSLSKIQDSTPAKITNGQYTTGIQNIRGGLTLSGTGYATIPEYNLIRFEKNDNFAISMWINIPTSQDVVTSKLNTILSKGNANKKNNVFKLQVYNQNTGNNKKLLVSRGDRYGESTITSAALTSGVFNHIVFQKSGSNLELYINNSLEGITLNSINSDTFFTDYPMDLILGGYVDTDLSIIPEFSGVIDEVRIYNKTLSQTEIGDLYNNPYNTNIIGNVYYKHGIVVINNLSGSYGDIYKFSSDTLRFNSVIEVKELRIEVTKDASEFNFTMNPSVFVKTNNYNNRDLTPVVSSSMQDFSAYITTISFMNDKQEILATAKLKKALKAKQDLPIKFVVRMDV